MLGRGRFYREDQARDERGRWGEGGGSAAEKVGTGTPTVPGSMPGLVTPGTRPIMGAGRGPTDPRWTVRAGNNKIVTMRLGAESGNLAVAGQRPDPVVIAKILNGVADAYERDPRPDGPPDVVLHSVEGYTERLRARGMSDEDAARAAANTRASVESSRPWEINVVAGTATAEYHGNYMPSSAALAAKGDLMASTMAHEYGHVRFFETVNKDRVNKETALFVRPDIKAALSPYGRSNHLEAVAEAYSEWHLTGGQTDNLAAKAYAEKLGWKTPKAQTAGRVERFYSEDQQRDEKGRFGPGGGGGGGKAEPVSISSLPPGGWETHPQEWAKAAYEMKGKGFSTTVDRAYTHNYELHVKGSITSELTGGKVGNFERKVFVAANADGTFDNVVEHELLLVDRKFEGHDIAAGFNAHAEEAYKAAGITRIDLHANIDVGGYAWARAGYEWDPKSAGARTVGDHVANLNDQYERFGHHTKPMAIGEHFTPNLSELPDGKVIQKAVEEQHAKLFNDEVAAAAAKLAADPNLKVRDVAQLGYKQGAVIKAENGQRYWAGKLLLMGQHWYGSKRLAPAMTPVEYEAQAKKLQPAAATTVTLARKPRLVQEPQPDPALKARLKAAGAPDYNYPPVDWEDKGDGPVDFGPEPATDRAEKLSEISELVAEFARKRKRKRTVARIPQIYQRHPMPLYQPLPPPAPTPSPPPAPAPGDGGSPPAPPSGGGAAAPASARTDKLAEVRRLTAELGFGEVTKLYSEDQPREHGRFAPKGEGGGGTADKPAPEAKVALLGPPLGPKGVLVRGQREVTETTVVSAPGRRVPGWTTTAADGKQVVLRQGDQTAPEISTETARSLLNSLADAYDQHPREGGPPEIVAHGRLWYSGEVFSQGYSEAQATEIAKGTQAFVDRENPGQIHVVMENLGMPYVYSGMPAAKAAEDLNQGTITHEYGHVIMDDKLLAASGDQAGALHDKADALAGNARVQAAMSKYARSAPMEAVAEAYQEWALTKGTSGNLAAKAYAKAFDWPTWKAAK